MSTESLSREDLACFTWQPDLDRSDYVLATYVLETPIDPELAAVAIAKEQSMATLRLSAKGYESSSAMAARLVSVEVHDAVVDRLLPGYKLTTEVYPESGINGSMQRLSATIAYPLPILSGSIIQLWNVVLGEIPRLGFLNAMRLVDLQTPPAFLAGFTGPRHGVPGLRAQTTLGARPLLCRSCRPALGLSVEAMRAINDQVLLGGFDAVKDDELTVAATPDAYRERLRTLAAATRAVEQHSGERKLYFANVISDPDASLEQLRQAESAGVDGIIIAPAIQGLASARWFSRHSELPILAHNTVDDIFTRHPRFGVSPAVYLKLLRISGADLVFLPGNFGTGNEDAAEIACAVAACLEPMGHIAPCWPIIAGGKRPEKLQDYVRQIGSRDFMVIAATAVDEHADGLAAGARAFRNACSRLPP
ncbi:MAG: hypothetical protein A3H91_10270 [Gammaproteobacteria bacterium RIFCSPLOWO2_02_FULL_61_13]|nr:MAG: hypothetical protein A3H91_10270 [Gammaproteobacteria bacterium RIFCSPLOWO2_02_FULL_61_13]